MKTISLRMNVIAENGHKLLFNGKGIAGVQLKVNKEIIIFHSGSVERCNGKLYEVDHFGEWKEFE